MISCWSKDDGDWFFDEAERDFPNKSELLYDITKAIRVWGPLKDEDWSTEMKTLLEEEDKKESDMP